jgi:hypothetical protein
VIDIDPTTGQQIVHELGGVIADGVGITNLVFIRAFERLVLKTVEALPFFPHLRYIRIRFIDLDSPCTLLNPYWLLEKGKVYGIWNEEIVDKLHSVRPAVAYDSLDDGIEFSGWNKSHHYTAMDAMDQAVMPVGGCSLYPKLKPRSIKTSSYKIVAEARGS